MASLQYLTKRQSVAEVLRTEILNGSLLPGTQLQQEEVAARLGLSSTPVREAFGLLEAEGFVESRPHRGVVVTQHDGAEIQDYYEMRTVLEAHAVRRVVARATDDVLDGLERILADAARALAKGDLKRTRRANTEFHQKLAVASGSPTLVEMLNRLIAHSLFFIPLEVERFRAIHKEHLALAAAIRRRDPERAAKVLTTELDRTFKAERDAGALGATRTEQSPVVRIRARTAKRSAPARAAARG